ncbi:NAD(P)H-dependent flavin oxidoreductase [Streptomyces sp. NPDC051310]|uniref:NAD(P)H-dependent flavin oxidoreductase n=1 Tax=Streptomyces sp. NPDC051310 TaxID=3365649 RepID=UPI0037872B31
MAHRRLVGGPHRRHRRPALLRPAPLTPFQCWSTYVGHRDGEPGHLDRVRRTSAQQGHRAARAGTAFLATRESGASDVHKRRLGTPAARTTVLTRLFSGRTARGIPNRFVRDMAAYEDAVPPYPVQNALMQPIRRAAAAQGRPEYVNLWAGQAAALAGDGLRAREYLAQLVKELPGRGVPFGSPRAR